MQKKKQKLPKTSPFIHKLSSILDQQEHELMISWLPCGMIFAIHKPLEFAAELLPKYFKHSNYGSFLRQLNFYNFTKIIRNTGSAHQFQHPLFLRGEHERYSLIKSQRSKKDGRERQQIQQCRSFHDQSQQIVQPPLEVRIQQLKRNQDSLLSQCKEIIDQGIQTIEWGLIRSAEIQNDSSSNRLICNRIFDFLDRYPQLAGHLNYLDTDVVHKLLEHLDTDLVDNFRSGPYSPAISKFFSLVENNQMCAVVECISSGYKMERRKKKSYTIMRKEEMEVDFSCAVMPLNEEM